MRNKSFTCNKIVLIVHCNDVTINAIHSKEAKWVFFCIKNIIPKLTLVCLLSFKKINHLVIFRDHLKIQEYIRNYHFPNLEANF